MSSALQPKPRVNTQKVRICVVASKYNENFTDALVAHTLNELDEIIPMARIDLVRVTGAFEIPVTVAKLLGRQKFHCVIALGVIIHGETQHADLVATSITAALQGIAVQHCIPIIHEVLLVNNENQAHERCLGDTKNRGREAAQAAANMIEIFAQIEKSISMDVQR